VISIIFAVLGLYMALHSYANRTQRIIHLALTLFIAINALFFQVSFSTPLSTVIKACSMVITGISLLIVAFDNVCCVHTLCHDQESAQAMPGGFAMIMLCFATFFSV